MTKRQTPVAVRKLLIQCYELSLRGLPGMPTAVELADRYRDKYGDAEKAIDKLITWQAAKCSASGFLTGLGGLLTIPVAVPADLVASFYVTVRMVAAIAHLRGHDLEDESTRTAVFLCLVGDAAVEVLHKAGMELGTALARGLLQRLPAATLEAVEKAVGVKIAAKAGEASASKLGRLAPVAGALIGAAVNGAGCRAIGQAAKAQL